MLRREDGSAAVEFALIAPILFFALFSLVEIGMLAMVTSGLDNAVIDASRRIRTGRGDAATTAQEFEDQICGEMGGGLGACRDRLTISVQTFTRFVDVQAVTGSAPDGAFDKGGANDIIIVKADYRWPLMTPFVATGFERDGPTEVTIASRNVFKNEPFE